MSVKKGEVCELDPHHLNLRLHQFTRELLPNSACHVSVIVDRAFYDDVQESVQTFKITSRMLERFTEDVLPTLQDILIDQMHSTKKPLYQRGTRITRSGRSFHGASVQSLAGASGDCHYQIAEQWIACGNPHMPHLDVRWSLFDGSLCGICHCYSLPIESSLKIPFQYTKQIFQTSSRCTGGFIPFNASQSSGWRL